MLATGTAYSEEQTHLRRLYYASDRAVFKLPTVYEMCYIFRCYHIINYNAKITECSEGIDQDIK